MNDEWMRKPLRWRLDAMQNASANEEAATLDEAIGALDDAHLFLTAKDMGTEKWAKAVEQWLKSIGAVE